MLKSYSNVIKNYTHESFRFAIKTLVIVGMSF